MSQREEFVRKAMQSSQSFTSLCSEFGISRKTGYKWLKRYRQEGEEGLQDRSRRPHHSPKRTPLEEEQVILNLRNKHPAWGGRMLHGHLKLKKHPRVPAPSTITAILQRNHKIDPQESAKHRPMQRFERARPNELWQMDFKGYFFVQGQVCWPHTVLDDHARFLLGLKACQNQQRETVQAQLTGIFRQYGLPDALLMDNGSPWGPSDPRAYYTRLSVWLMRLGIRVIRSRPYHPQTLGKDERLHRTLKTELISRTVWHSFEDCQVGFDTWRELYNTERPHWALGSQPPVSRYQPSPRSFPEHLPPIVHPDGAQVRMARDGGRISFHGKRFRIGHAFDNLPVGVLPGEKENCFDVYFCTQKIKTITLQD